MGFGQTSVHSDTMKLIFEIEYHTVWGERLVLRSGTRTIDLHHIGNGIWQGCADLRHGEAFPDYRYSVERDGATLRTEWLPHEFRLPRGCTARRLRIRDRWQDLPSDAPFHTTAFTRVLFARHTTPPAPPTEPRDRDTTPSPERLPAEPPGRPATIRLTLPAIRPDETLAIASAHLDEWQRIVALDDSLFPTWTFTADLPADTPYKLLIADRATLEPRLWEEGENRRWQSPSSDDEQLVDASICPHFPERRWHGAGTAVPLFSLRSEEGLGIGEFPDLKLLVDWAVATGQRAIQLLPINDTTTTGTWRDSYPYNANSSFALHPQFIRLTDAGIEEDESYRQMREELNALPDVDYEQVNRIKQRLLRASFARNGARTTASPDYRSFVAANRPWLLPYAAFCTLRDDHGSADFTRWGDLSRYEEAKVEEFCTRRRDDIAYHCYVQYHLHRQLAEAVRYARSRGVLLKGDLPIGIGRTSADAWQHPHLFRMGMQAGAPPDAFSATGQNWGFPTYDWERMSRDGYAWWRSRLRKMSDYFDAYRIDHILGFFRIWEIPADAVHGVLGHFSPALPYSAEELHALGFDLSATGATAPHTDDALLDRLFGDLAAEVRTGCLHDGRLTPEYSTQRKVMQLFPDSDDRSKRLREGLLKLLDDVLFVADPYREGYLHPRIAGHTTYAFSRLSASMQEQFAHLHDDFFYRRHDRLWQASAWERLPALLSSTGMLACGEDLGMIPSCVPATMHRLQILTLEIQRMPKEAGERFADPSRYPYLSVCATSTHDMPPLRAWWEEDRERSAAFYRERLHGTGEAPARADATICRRIVAMHLAAPSMWTILPLQDWLSQDPALCRPHPEEERINDPSDPHHYWRYRMHLTLEQLLAEEEFNRTLRRTIASHHRG